MTSKQKQAIKEHIAIHEKANETEVDDRVKADRQKLIDTHYKQLEQEVDDRDHDEIVEDQIASLKARLENDANILTDLEKEGIEKHIHALNESLK